MTLPLIPFDIRAIFCGMFPMTLQKNHIFGTVDSIEPLNSLMGKFSLSFSFGLVLNIASGRNIPRFFQYIIDEFVFKFFTDWRRQRFSLAGK